MNVNMANMNAMGGPVGGAPMQMAMNNGAMAQVQAQRQDAATNRTILNTYIYDYFLREGMFECARAMVTHNHDINVNKLSPGRRREEPSNVIGDDPMDTDSKEDVESKRREDLPTPNLPASSDSCFLYEWFCLFWDMLGAQRHKQGGSQQVNQYISYTQQQSRMKSTEQQNMLRQMRPDGPNGMQFNPVMRQMQNGMAMNAKGNNLARTAMANNQNNPQAMQMLQQAKQNQMQRDPSDMNGNRRPASPGSADNAPSPSKRPRLDGNTPFNPQQAGTMMPNGRPQPQGMPGQQVGSVPTPQQVAHTNSLLLSAGIAPQQLTASQLHSFQTQPPANQQKSIQSYAQSLQQHHGQQIPNKGMQNPGGPQGQGSPMMPQGPNSAQDLSTFYNTNEIAGANNMRPGGPAAGGGQGGGSNHALQDYQMQLMLLEQQNKKRLMMARQEQDSMTGGPREGPPGGGPGGAGPPGANGQPFADTSPQGQRPGASPNPSEQMKRATPQMGPAGIPSPLPEGSQSRGSPNGMGFMPQSMDPNGMQQHFFKVNGMEGNMAAVQMNGGMRGPSSHPGQPFNGQMNPQMMAQRQQGQGGPGGPQMQQWQGPNGANPMAQGPQGPVQGTPQHRSMPPPSAPALGVNANARTQPSSPANSNPAPPTPQQSNKAPPKKKDTKNAKSKAAANKKNANTGATPVAEASQEPEAAPATPITPVNPSFAKNGPGGGGAQAVPNAQTSAAPPAPPPVAQQHPDPTQGGFSMDNGGGMVDFNSLDFTNPMNGPDVLQDFDFDSFLHDNDGGDGAFDFNASNFTIEGAGEIQAE